MGAELSKLCTPRHRPLQRLQKTNAHARTCTHTCTHIHTAAHAHAHMEAPTHTYTYINLHTVLTPTTFTARPTRAPLVKRLPSRRAKEKKNTACCIAGVLESDSFGVVKAQGT